MFLSFKSHGLFIAAIANWVFNSKIWKVKAGKRNWLDEVVTWLTLVLWHCQGHVAEWLVRSLSEWQATGTNPAVGKHVTDHGQYAVHLNLSNRYWCGSRAAKLTLNRYLYNLPQFKTHLRHFILCLCAEIVIYPRSIDSRAIWLTNYVDGDVKLVKFSTGCVLRKCPR